MDTTTKIHLSHESNGHTVELVCAQSTPLSSMYDSCLMFMRAIVNAMAQQVPKVPNPSAVREEMTQEEFNKMVQQGEIVKNIGD